MSIITKSAGLTSMARDEPDVYETEDLPEVDQKITMSDEASIEKIVINIEDAKKVFNGKCLNSEGVDFSDRIRAFLNTGYSIDTNEYVLYPYLQHNLETPLQRYQRLQLEVQNLIDDVEQVKLASLKDGEGQLRNKELLNMGKEMETVTHGLGSYKLHCSLGSDHSANIATDEDYCHQESRKMFEEIERYISKHKKNESSGDKLTWEKYYQSPTTKELDDVKLADLNNRVQRLESNVGFSDRDLSSTSLNCETTTKSLIEAVKILQSRCMPLKGGPNVDKIETRLVNLQSKLQSITEKRDVIKDADCQNKVAELFTLVEKWKEFQHVLPVIAQRLENLQELHNQAIHFTDNTTYLDKNQLEMKKNMVLHKNMLTKIEENLKNYLKNTRSALESMEDKVGKI